MPIAQGLVVIPAAVVVVIAYISYDTLSDWFTGESQDGKYMMLTN